MRSMLPVIVLSILSTPVVEGARADNASTEPMTEALEALADARARSREARAAYFSTNWNARFARASAEERDAISAERDDRSHLVQLRREVRAARRTVRHLRLEMRVSNGF